MGLGDFYFLVGLAALGCALFLRFSSSRVARRWLVSPDSVNDRPALFMWAIWLILLGIGAREGSPLPRPPFLEPFSLPWMLAGTVFMFYGILIARSTGEPAYPMWLLPPWLREELMERQREEYKRVQLERKAHEIKVLLRQERKRQERERERERDD